MYYICGYVALKEEIVCEDENDLASLPPVSEFTIKLSRGKLKLPPINLYDLLKQETLNVVQRYFLQLSRKSMNILGIHFYKLIRSIGDFVIVSSKLS